MIVLSTGRFFFVEAVVSRTQPCRHGRRLRHIGTYGKAQITQSGCRFID